MKRTKRFTLRRVALGLAVAAVLVPTAQAKPTPGKQQPRPEIPYLSHGVLTPPVDFWNYDQKTGEKLYNTSPGVAPDKLAELYGASSTTMSPDDRPLSRATSVTSGSVAASDDGYGVGTGTIGVAGLALLFAAGGAGLAIRHSRKTRLSPA
jgi:hypothetical protein